MMRNALFGGVNVAVLTPMQADFSVDLDRMAAHCRWLLVNGCNGLAILGTTGEANSLGVEERIGLMEGLVARGISPKVLLPGVGTPAVPDTVLLARKALQLGCRGVLMLPPFFYKNPSEDGLFAYFATVIERVGPGLAYYLYHFPAQSAVPITPGLIARLLRAFPGAVKGVKDSSGDFANTRGYVEAFAAEGFEVYCGDDGALHDLLKIGGAGSISAASNVSSSVNAEVYANAGTERGESAQALLSAIRKAVTATPLIAGLKSLLARHWSEPAWKHIRPPNMPLSAEAEARLFQAFDATGFAIPKA
ncbi:MAG: dihydrodipicolinate synthase family protein [Acidobacteriia bacterium]|nr:dihydrodipicolinate synthase family protein [Methyloceanibacter sp.]MCL6491764.1 dihydrodipicolinate synthase family protein [Terriglobia bacterium]